MSNRQVDEEAYKKRVPEAPRRGRSRFRLPWRRGSDPEPSSSAGNNGPSADRSDLILVTFSPYRLRWPLLKDLISTIFQPANEDQKKLWGLDRDQSSIGEKYMFWLPRPLSKASWMR